MEMISRISKGSRMDQVYIPKNRPGFSIGSYVVIRPLETEKVVEQPYFYNIRYIEPIKVKIIHKLITIIDKNCSYENIMITGSFLDKGFHFNDLDIVLITDHKADIRHIEEKIKKTTGIKTHIILLTTKALMHGLSTDPLYQMMLSRCIAKKRFIYNVKHKIDYKILDIHLLKSKTLIENYDLLDGNEKYYFTRNMVSILLYIIHKKVTKEAVDKEIMKIFDVSVKEIKLNMLDKTEFLKRYKHVYDKTFNKIMRNIKHGSEQK